MDRYFTSLSIADWLLEKNITVIGTMKENRVGIPQELRSPNGREVKSTISMHNSNNGKKKMLISWVDQKKSGLKNIIMLTTMHGEVKVSRDERKKPHVMVFYDNTKGGVDVVDLHASTISTRVKSRRLSINAFSFSLDTARTNARTLNDEVVNKSTSNFYFTWNLGKALVLPHIQRRYEDLAENLPALIVQKMCTVLNIQNIPRAIPKPDQAASGGRCYMCLEAISSKRGYKTKKSKLNNHLKTFCQACEYTICTKHSYLTCDNCHREQQENREQEEI